MRRQVVDAVAPPIYGTIDFLVVVAPAFAVKLASDRGGMGDTDGLDVVAASVVLGAFHAVIAGSRLRAEERTAVRRADMWIAAVDALVVLTLAATLLPVVVLWGFADEHASIAERGYPVVALWTGVQLLAVVLAEATGRLVFWWLEPHPRSPFRVHGHLVGLRSPWLHGRRAADAARPSDRSAASGSDPPVASNDADEEAARRTVDLS
jgi:hypothetical protein